MDDEGEQATPQPKIVEYVMDKEASTFRKIKVLRT
jgi:hypothetical protein